MSKKILASLIGSLLLGTLPVAGEETIYAHEFNGEGSLNEMPLTTGDGAWVAGAAFGADGSVGDVGQAAWLPFAPESGFEYTATATILNPDADWIAFGYMPENPPIGPWTGETNHVRHSFNGAYGWVIARNYPGSTVAGFNGPNTLAAAFNVADVSPAVDPVTLSIVLNTREPVWRVSYWINGNLVPGGADGLHTLASAAVDSIGGIGFSRYGTGANGRIVDFSLTAKDFSTVPPFITDVSPANGAVLHPAANGIQFSVSTVEGNTIAEEDIGLFLNGEAVPPGELVITGSSPSFDVAYYGLVSNSFYTARATVSDNAGSKNFIWKFDTFGDGGFGVAALEDIPLNQATDDDLQGIVPVSSYKGALAEDGSLLALTDAFSATGPTGNVIPSFDTEVTLTWDLGDPDSAEHRSLTGMNIWIAGYDPLRTGFDGEIAVSNDGKHFTAIPNSRFAADTGFGRYNLVRYQFAPEAMGFRYLRLISYGYDNAGESILRQPRFVEIDAYIDNGAPRITEISPVSGAFFSPVEPVQFTVSTDAPNTIDPAGIELVLNGETIASEDLTITGTSPSFEVSYNGLEVNQVYTAEAIVWDNERAASYVWEFDTVDAAASVTIEATDYNFGVDGNGNDIVCDPEGNPEAIAVTGGIFIDDPLPSVFDEGSNNYVNRDDSGTRVGYVDRVGVPDVDFHTTAVGTGLVGQTSYRWCEPVRTKRIEEGEDLRRPKFIDASLAADVEIPDYQLHSVKTGEWWNYTRTFPAGTYRVLLRARATGGSPVLRLDRVTSDPSVAGQTTVALGEFAPTPTEIFDYVSLTNPVDEAFITLSGEETLRLTAVNANNNVNLNYLLLVPVADAAPRITNLSPAPDALVAPESTLSFEVSGPPATPESGIAVSINGVDVTENLVITGDDLHWFVSYEGIEAADEILIEASNPEGTTTVAFTYPAGIEFTSWIATFDLPSGLTGPGDDADGDGIRNLVEYALGGNPGEPSRDILPTAEPQADAGVDYLTLAIDRNSAAVGVSLVVEVSADLVEWLSGPEHTTVLSDTATQLVVRDNQSLAENPRRFIRLRVVEE